MLADKRNKTFCQSDEPDTQRSLIDYARDGLVRFQVVCAYPEILHEQRELLGHRRLLELHAFVELACCDVEHIIELGKEKVDALLSVFVMPMHSMASCTMLIVEKVRLPRPMVVLRPKRFSNTRVRHPMVATSCL